MSRWANVHRHTAHTHLYAIDKEWMHVGTFCLAFRKYFGVSFRNYIRRPIVHNIIIHGIIQFIEEVKFSSVEITTYVVRASCAVFLYHRHKHRAEIILRRMIYSFRHCTQWLRLCVCSGKQCMCARRYGSGGCLNLPDNIDVV